MKRWIVAGLVVVALIAWTIVVWPDDPDPDRASATAPPTDPTSTLTDLATTTTAPATRTSRTFPVVAATDTEYLVWSGEAGANDVSQRADGFAVDLATGTVRPIPVAPIDPRSGATGVWTGTELIVCCGTGRYDGFAADTGSTAAWNPTTGAWRTLAPAPASVARSYPASVWTGDLLVVMATGPAVATYDPTTDRWTDVVTPPTVDRRPQAAWTGDEVILWDARHGSGVRPADGAIADRGWRWVPGAAEWTPLPDLPDGARTQLGSMGWTGRDIVVWGQSVHDDAIGVGARWRPGDDRWHPIGASPQGRVDAYDGTPGSQALVADPDHRRVLIRGLQGSTDGSGGPTPLYAYDPASDRWSDVGLDVRGYSPQLTIARAHLLAPDEARPVVGPIPP